MPIGINTSSSSGGVDIVPGQSGTNKPPVFTVDQLMQLSNVGTCQVSSPAPDNKVCAQPTQAALSDPNKIVISGTSRKRFKVQNNSANPLYFGFGESLSKPGLTPLYANSVFAGKEGVNNANFFVGDSLIPIASGPNSLGTQAQVNRTQRALISRIALVNIDQGDTLASTDMQFERTFPTTGKATTEEVSPECNACGGTNSSNKITAAFDLGLAPADELNGIGILIPGTAEGPGTIYTVDVDFAFYEGAHGYVAVPGSGIGV